MDTEEDYKVAQTLYGSLYQPDKIFSLDEIIDYLAANPEVMTINKNVHQKRLGE